MAAERVITERLDAVCKAGAALWHLEQIRDSTLAGTALWNAADAAVRQTTRVIAELYTQPAGAPPALRS